MRIVVVEDGVKIRRGIINLIQKIDPGYYVVGEAANGVDGINVIVKTKPDLVIADIRMPELNGLEMLQALKEKEIKHKTIILSAYSDFSFAQQAISIGVSEYLLKPVTAEKLQNSLSSINQELILENQKKVTTNFLSIKSVFQDLLMGKKKKINELSKYLNRESGFDGSQPFAMVGAYTGNKVYDQDSLHQLLTKLFSKEPNFQFIIFDAEMSGLTLFLLSCRNDFSIIETFIETQLTDEVHRHDFPNLIMGWITVNSHEELHSKFQQLRELFNWALIFDKNEIITQSKVAKFTLKPLVYPNQLEKQAVAAISRNRFQNLQEIGDDFIHWWEEDKYLPEQIIASFVRFISSLTNTVKETNPELFKHIKQQQILQQVLNGITMDNLEAALHELFNRLIQTDQTNRSGYGLIVIKTLKLIAENYQTGMTREEIASKLHITPEYLSMLFYKEVGQSFTTYLKNYRINKAKELLANTQLKIYEVAEKVGYLDSKYFCRVFKEATGISAGEYQKSLTENNG